MQKWEYQVLDIEKAFYKQHADDVISEQLNMFGQEGWEVVGYATFEVHKLILKRPI